MEHWNTMWFYGVLLVVLLAGKQCSGDVADCVEKEKSLGILDFARKSIEKAENLFLSSFDDNNSTNTSVCGKKEKGFAYLQIAKDLIAEAEKNYPNCSNVETTEFPDVNTTYFPDVNTTYFPDLNFTYFPELNYTYLPEVNFTYLPELNYTYFPELNFTYRPELNYTYFPELNYTYFPEVNYTYRPDMNYTYRPEVNTTEVPDVNFTRLPEVNNTEPPRWPPMDCNDVLENGHITSGVYTVWPRNSLTKNAAVKVYCDMDTDEGGWTVIQRRGGFPALIDFNQNWNTYKKGFGDLREEFWFGNDNIYVITNQSKYEVRIDLTDFEGNQRYAVYKTFWIEDENNDYTLHVEDYYGDAGDSMEYENLSKFSTFDRINENTSARIPCAKSREAGWWYYMCNKANINGRPKKRADSSDKRNLYWQTWKAYESLATAEMKLRRIEN